MANCQSCGNELKKGGKFCAACGAPAPEETEVVVQTVQVGAAPITTMNTTENLPADNMGLIAFICGILGITLCCGITSIPALICAIVSMKNVKAGKVKNDTSWMGIVGLVLGILGTLLLIAYILYFVFVFLVAFNY